MEEGVSAAITNTSAGWRRRRMPRQGEFASDTKLPVVDVVPLEQTGSDPGRDRDPESGSFGNAQKQCRRFGFVRSRICGLGLPAYKLIRRLSTHQKTLRFEDNACPPNIREETVFRTDVFHTSDR